MTKSDEIKIIAKPFDSERCQFTADRPVVLAGGTFQFQNKGGVKEYSPEVSHESSHGSHGGCSSCAPPSSQSSAEGAHPLAEEIFEMGGGRIKAVQLSGNNVTVAAEAGTDWRTMAKAIGGIIREYLISEAANFEQTLAAVGGDNEQQIRLKVQRVLDTQINPAVAGHGGQITLLDVKGDAVYIKMGGGCQGCGMASVTLKGGVEKAIRQYVPEVKDIFDTTDHASGKNPYYSPSK